MKNNKERFFIRIFVLSLLACAPVFGAAQTIKYITYFPAPHAYYTRLNVQNTALLATRGQSNIDANMPAEYDGGRLEVGTSGQTETLAAKFTVSKAFSPYNLILQTQSTSPASVMTDICVGCSSTTAATPSYYGTFGTLGHMTISESGGAKPFSPVAIIADNTLTVNNLYWTGKGGFGKDKNNASTWGACSLTSSTALQWKQMKITGTDSYRVYLTCP